MGGAFFQTAIQGRVRLLRPHKAYFQWSPLTSTPWPRLQVGSMFGSLRVRSGSITGHRRNLYFLPHTNSAGNRFWTSCGGLCPTFSNKWRSKGPVKKSWCPSEVWICPKATRFSLALRFTRHRRLASFFRLASLGVRIVVDLDQLKARDGLNDAVSASPRR